MDFELKLDKPRRREAYLSALVMGIAYFIGNDIEDLSHQTRGADVYLRRLAANDPIFCHEQDAKCLVHFDRHHGTHSHSVRLPESKNVQQHQSSSRKVSDHDACHRRSSRRIKLWYRAGSGYHTINAYILISISSKALRVFCLKPQSSTITGGCV